MSKEGSRCKSNDPMDCFSCPYDDCIASGIDINRQNAAIAKKDREERDKRIVSMWNQGYSIEHLCAEFNMGPSRMKHILYEARKREVNVK